ncbi:MAG: hypothetical protein A4E66_00191 [Syntrophus sp. PtaB.Bin001]|nr:MAG: hypothetical protein A4E66_00191 [Syntrophus sp. PtaB.Bin001]
MEFFGSASDEQSVISKGTKFQKHRVGSEFALSPAGQARAAKSAGMKIFQIDIPISKARGSAAMVGAIQSVENEGWKFDNVSCVYCINNSISTDKLSNCEWEEDEIIGVYIFRNGKN